MMQVSQVYKLASSDRQNSLLGLRIIVEKTSYQHQRPSSQVDFAGVFGMHQLGPKTTAFALADTARLEGLALHFGGDYYGLRPRRHSSARGACPPLRWRLLQLLPSPI